MVEVLIEINHVEISTPRKRAISTTRIQPIDEITEDVASTEALSLRESKSSTTKTIAGNASELKVPKRRLRNKNITRNSETAVDVDKSQFEIGSANSR